MSAQTTAFAAGVPPDICAFHRYTMNSIILSRTQDKQYRRQFRGPLPNSSHGSIEWRLQVEPGGFTPDLPNRLRALYAQ